MDKQALVNVPRTLLDNTVRYVEVSSLLAKKALDECHTHRQAQKRAAELRPALLTHLLSLGVVGAAQKEAADAMLGGHAETLNLLKVAADKIAKLTEELTVAGKGEKRAGADLGRGEDDTSNHRQKQANDSLSDPRVGGNHNFVKESDKILLRQIGK